ncbi:MAG: polysaccharide deacetylase family protein [Candidatus Thiodiazotropha sp.]
MTLFAATRVLGTEPEIFPPITTSLKPAASLWLLGILLFTLFPALLHANQSIAIRELQSQWGTGWQAPMSMDLPEEWMRVGTEGDGRPVFIQSETLKLDLQKKILSFQMRINSIDYLAGIELRFASDKSFESYFSIPIPLYTVKSFNLLQADAWHTFSFGLGNAKMTGEPKSDAIRYLGIYLQDNALAPLVFDFTDIKVTSAQMPAMLSYTFDDGYDDHMLAAKIMARYGHAGTAYIIPQTIGKTGYLTEVQLKEMQRLGWGISSHHATPFVDFDALTLKTEIESVLQTLEQGGFSNSMRHLAYPLGQQNRTYVQAMTRTAFDTARIAGGGMETLPPGDRWLLRTYNVMHDTSIEDLRREVRLAKANNQWLILMFHYLAEKPANDLEFSEAQFVELVEMIDKEEIEVKPVHEVYNLIREHSID